MIEPAFGLEDFSDGLEALRYEHYYRKHGVKTFKSLLAPRYSSMENLELPLKSVLHYLPELSSELGIMPTNVFLRNHSGMILVHNAVEYVEPEGTPMLAAAKPAQLTLQYRKSARSLRPMRSYDTAFRNDKTLVVENYCFLNHLYRYRNTFMARIYKFKNLMRVFVAKVNEIAEISDRKQFLELRLPKQQILLQRFIMGGKRTSRQTLGFFQDDHSLFLLELWKFFGENRESSALAGLTPKAIMSLQFVLIETGKYNVLSLGLLENSRDGASEPASTTYKPRQIQLTFYKYLNSGHELRNVANKQVIEVRENENGEETLVTIGEDGEETVLDVDSVDDLDVMTEAETQEAMDESESGQEIDFDLEDELDPGVQESEVYIPVDDSDLDNVPVEVTELSAGVVAESLKLLELGLISAAAHKRNEQLATAYKRIPNPWGQGTLADAIVVDPAKLEVRNPKFVEDISFVMDKSMLKSGLKNFDRDYVDNVMNSDIAGMVVNLQKAGVIVHNYRVEEKEDANNHFDVHYVQMSLVEGKVSTVAFRVPRVTKDGTFRARGTNYRLRKQRVDIPIRKTAENEVGLTSYVSKVFVTRSVMKVHDYTSWLQSQILRQVEAGVIKHVDYGNVFDRTVKTPRTHSTIAAKYTMFAVGDLNFDWNLKTFTAMPDLDVPALLKEGLCPCGFKGKELLVIDTLGVVSLGSTSEPIGNIEEILGIESAKAPVDTIFVKVLDKQIPISVIMAYHLGLTNYLKSLKVPYRLVAKGSKLDLTPDEFTIKFSDTTLILNRNHQRSALAVSGFNVFKKSIAKYPMMEFDSEDVYGAVFDQEGLGGRYLRELKITNDLWVDPITLGILTKRKEPTEWLAILRYSIELLTSDEHPAEGAGTMRRTRGYERISGHVYSEMVRSVRKAKSRPLTANAAIELNPNAVWMNIQKDASVGIVNELNPVEETKEVELMTFAGSGGRTGRTMVHSTRGFDHEDLGTVSEAGVDNSNVAVNTYSVPDPNIDDLRGMRGDWVFNVDDTARILSTSTLLGVGATTDDMKRAVFSGVQHSHVVATVGYGVCAVQTGYETVLAHRVSDTFAVTVDSPATLVHVSNDHIVIEYDDPDRPNDKIPIGIKYGVSTGHAILHDVICDLPQGTKLKAGHVVAFNRGFFARNYIDPSQVTWKTGAYATVMLIDDADTLEDSSAISPELAGKLLRPTVDYREVTLRFDQGILDLVKEGDKVEVDSILCSIEDSVTSGGNLFDDTTKDSLKLLARNTPKAKTVGVIGKVEVLYCGDTEDLSPSLAELVLAADKKRTKYAKSIGSKVLTGQVNDLDLDTVKIGIYINRETKMADGDKLVVGNQLKSVVKRVMTGKNETLSGKRIDAKFGNLSVDARIVGGPAKAGTTIVLVEMANKRAASAYRNK